MKNIMLKVCVCRFYANIKCWTELATHICWIWSIIYMENSLANLCYSNRFPINMFPNMSQILTQGVVPLCLFQLSSEIYCSNIFNPNPQDFQCKTPPARQPRAPPNLGRNSLECPGHSVLGACAEHRQGVACNNCPSAMPRRRGGRGFFMEKGWERYGIYIIIYLRICIYIYTHIYI